MMKPRASAHLQPCRPPAHFFRKGTGSPCPATSGSDEKGLDGTEKNSLRLAHVFFIILALHLVLVVVICLLFNILYNS